MASRPKIALKPEELPKPGQPVLLVDGDDKRIIALDRTRRVICVGFVRRIGKDNYLWVSINGEEGKRNTEWEAFMAMGYEINGKEIKPVRGHIGIVQPRATKRIYLGEEPKTFDHSIIRQFDSFIGRREQDRNASASSQDHQQSGTSSQPKSIGEQRQDSSFATGNSPGRARIIEEERFALDCNMIPVKKGDQVGIVFCQRGNTADELIGLRGVVLKIVRGCGKNILVRTDESNTWLNTDEIELVR